MVRNDVIVTSADVESTTHTSNQSEWASTTMRNVFRRNEPAWSMWSLAQGQDGHFHGLTGTYGGAGHDS